MRRRMKTLYIIQPVNSTYIVLPSQQEGKMFQHTPVTNKPRVTNSLLIQNSANSLPRKILRDDIESINWSSSSSKSVDNIRHKHSLPPCVIDENNTVTHNLPSTPATTHPTPGTHTSRRNPRKASLVVS